MVRLIVAGFALVIFLATGFIGGGSVSAVGDGSVRIEPNSSIVQTGGDTDVSVLFEPAAEGVSVFIIEIKYDPTVVQFVDCLEWTPPPIGVGAAGCDVKDDDGDGVDETAVVFGAYVENRNGIAAGFEAPQTVGTITFMSVGKKGGVSPLHLGACSGCILAPNTDELFPVLHDGSICTTGKHGGTPNALRKCYGP